MRRVPFSIIEAAKRCDAEAVEFIRRHFEGYIVTRSLKKYSDQYGNEMYTEIRFPELGVRFIAVNDGVDSEDMMGNDFTPFRNLVWIKKIHAKNSKIKCRNTGNSKGFLAC